MTTTPEIDAVTFEVASAALLSAAEEMGSLLKRSSYSPIIRDMDDFSCAIFTASGDLVAQADYIPAQLGAMSLVVSRPRPVTIKAVDQVETLYVPRSAFLKLCNQSPDLAARAADRIRAELVGYLSAVEQVRGKIGSRQ